MCIRIVRDTGRSLAIAYIFSLGASREPRAVGGETAPARRARALAACTHAHARESRLWEASSDTQQIETDLPKPLKSWRYTQILLATYSHAWRGAPWKCDRRKRRSWSQHMDAKTAAHWTRKRVTASAFVLFLNFFRNYNQVRANLPMHARTLTDSAGIAQHCGSVRAPPRCLEPTDHPQTPPLCSPTPLACPGALYVRPAAHRPLSMSRCAVCNPRGDQRRGHAA